MHFLIAVAANSGGQWQLLTHFLVPLIPFVLIVFFVYLFIGPVARRERQRAAEVNQRALDQWNRLEQKLDRIIEILERGPI